MTDEQTEPPPKACACAHHLQHRENLLLDMAHPLPPPGPDHYAARRARWLTPTDTQPHPRHVPRSHVRLQRLLSQPDPHRDQVWKRGIDQVWDGLVNGNRLKHRLPMSLVVCTRLALPSFLLMRPQIKVIHAAWRRDPDTWPEGAVAPDSDDPRATTRSPVSSAKPP